MILPLYLHITVVVRRRIQIVSLETDPERLWISLCVQGGEFLAQGVVASPVGRGKKYSGFDTISPSHQPLI